MIPHNKITVPPAIIALIKADHAAGQFMREIGARYGYSDHIIGRIVGKSRTNRPSLAPRGRTTEEARNPVYSPVRDGMRYHKSFTALLCGDPLPGMSALDKMRQKEDA